MPYIKDSRRKEIDDVIDDLIDEIKANPGGMHGDLNYVIARTVDGCLGKDLSYKNLQDMVGMLECCKHEIINRLVTPYEIKKCAENGDAFIHHGKQ